MIKLLDIDYINELLLEGKSVKEIRSILNLGEKKFQKQIKNQGYKYNQKIKKYEFILTAQNKDCETTTNSTTTAPTKDTTETTTITTTEGTTDTTTTSPTTIKKATTPSTTITTTEKNTIKYLNDNIELLRQLLDNYKRTLSTEGRNDIVINLISDKHLKPKPKTIRINEFVWQDWLDFTKDFPNYNKGDLVSQALIEFMEKYKK